LGILGIENRKPKIVNCISIQAGNNYQKKNLILKFLNFFFFLASARTQSRVYANSRLRPQGRVEGRRVRECVRPRGRPMSARMPRRARADAVVRADAFWRPRGRAMSARTLECVRSDASVLSQDNFITDATVRPSHGRRAAIVRSFVRLFSSA
jgi:hypothetical protein